MGVINMAHGEMVMIGAYTTVMNVMAHLGIIWAIPLAFCCHGDAGLLIEKFVVRQLYGRLMNTLLATWGLPFCCSRLCGWSSAFVLWLHIDALGRGCRT